VKEIVEVETELASEAKKAEINLLLGKADGEVSAENPVELVGMNAGKVDVEAVNTRVTRSMVDEESTQELESIRNEEVDRGRSSGNLTVRENVSQLNRVRAEAIASSVYIPQDSQAVIKVDYELTYYLNDLTRAYPEVLQEYDKSGVIKKSYTYGNERIQVESLAEAETQRPGIAYQTETEYYIYDGRGSVRQSVSDSGAVTKAYAYDPYGGITLGLPRVGNVYGYNGELQNAKTGLQYLRARYYASEEGRFTSEDTYFGDQQEPLTLHKYLYVSNDPYNYVDPSGHTKAKTGAPAPTKSGFKLPSMASKSSASSSQKSGSPVREDPNPPRFPLPRTFSERMDFLNPNSSYNPFNNSKSTAQSTGDLFSSMVKGVEYVWNQAKNVIMKEVRRIACELEKERIKQQQESTPKEKVYNIQQTDKINGIGVFWDEAGTTATILIGIGVTAQDAQLLILINKMNDYGYDESTIINFINNYYEKNKDNTIIVPGRGLDYYIPDDITRDLTKLMIKLEYENSDYTFPIVTEERLWEFKRNVETGGSWDLKQLPEWDNSSLYIFNGEIVDKDAPGNLLYGYMGTVYLIPPTILQFGGVYAQWKAGTVKHEWIKDTYGDDSMDQENILRGIEYLYILHKNPEQINWGGK